MLYRFSSSTFCLNATTLRTHIAFSAESEDFVPVHKTLDDEVNFSISTAKVRCQRQTAQLLFELRSLLDQVLASKVMSKSDHATTRSDFEQCVLK